MRGLQAKEAKQAKQHRLGVMCTCMCACSTMTEGMPFQPGPNCYAHTTNTAGREPVVPIPTVLDEETMIPKVPAFKSHSAECQDGNACTLRQLLFGALTLTADSMANPAAP